MPRTRSQRSQRSRISSPINRKLRSVMLPDGSIEFHKAGSRKLIEAFCEKKDYNLVTTRPLDDGTFIRIFSIGNHNDLEEDYILNTRATCILNDPTVSDNAPENSDSSRRVIRWLSGVGCNDCGGNCRNMGMEYCCGTKEYLKLRNGLLYGPVMFTRVDEDGDELGITKDSLNEIASTKFVVKFAFE